LTPTERETLERWTRRAKTAQAVAQRARLILGCAAGKTNTVVAYELPLTKQTVGKWRTRFLRRRLDGLLHEPRPGAPRTITDAQVERVLTQTLETTPADATHWSIRSMAQASRLSRSAVHRIWRAFALQPHRTETFKLSADPLFIVVLPPASGKHRDRLQRVKDCHLNRRQLIIIDGIIKLRAI
jgi:transposase